MKTEFPSFTINSEILRHGNTPNYIFFLHGFTGSLNDWRAVAAKINPEYNIVGIDIIGHGLSSSPEDVTLYTAFEISSQIQQVISSITTEKIILAGYSMGGRAALSFAAFFPSLLKGLILESCSPGIKSLSEREKRIRKDNEVINFLSSGSIESFANYWMNLEIFNTQKRLPDQRQKDLKKAKLLNNKSGLINSLKGFGAGVMPSFWSILKDISVKTLIISGELDTKYSDICLKMTKSIPDCTHSIIDSAGHNTHLEEPGKFIAEVNKYLQLL
jgi:2-succinyl-6-hydroxy-2,4-cyclohexadiene-1-carboxylate synthase